MQTCRWLIELLGHNSVIVLTTQQQLMLWFSRVCLSWLHTCKYEFVQIQKGRSPLFYKSIKHVRSLDKHTRPCRPWRIHGAYGTAKPFVPDSQMSSARAALCWDFIASCSLSTRAFSEASDLTCTIVAALRGEAYFFGLREAAFGLLAVVLADKGCFGIAVLIPNLQMYSYG